MEKLRKRSVSLLLVFSLCLSFFAPVSGDTVFAAEGETGRTIEFVDDNGTSVGNSAEMTKGDVFTLHPLLQPEVEGEEVLFKYKSNNEELVTVSAAEDSTSEIKVVKAVTEKTEAKITVEAYIKEKTETPEEMPTGAGESETETDPGTETEPKPVATAEFTVTVVPEITSIKLEDEVKVLPLNETYQLKATVLPAEAPQDVIYTSGDVEIATVSETGLVTPKKAGKTTITVQSKKYEEKKAMVRIVVIDVPVAMTLEKSAHSMMATETYQIGNAKVKFASGTETEVLSADLSYELKTTEDSKVITLAPGGLVTALELASYPQTATVVVTYKYEYKDEASGQVYTVEVKNECVITVTQIPVTKITLEEYETKTPLKLNDKYQIKWSVFPENATNKAVKFVSSDKSVASVTKEGLITAKDIGDAIISVVSEENSTVKAEFHVTVYQTEFNVADFGANGADNTADSKIIRDVLEYADKVDEPVNVYVPAGTYIIDVMMTIYSDTNFILDKDTVFKRKNGKSKNVMLRSFIDETTSGYTQCENVTISGGVWDGNSDGSEPSNLIYIGHAQNITIKDTTLKNTSGTHLLEFAGVKDALIDNVKFSDFVVCKKKGFYDNQAEKEAIQLDYCSAGSAPAMLPYDNIHCKNITIQNCKFENYASGIGSHLAYGKPAENIVIKNNEFKEITGACISLKNYKNVTITGNKASKCSTFLYASGSTGKVSKNTLKNSSFTRFTNSGIISQNGMTISNRSNFTVDGNYIYNFKSNAVCVWNGSTANVKNNKLYKSGLYGIRTQGSNITLSKNKFSKNKKGEYDTYKDAKVKSSDDIDAYYISVKKTYKYTGKSIKPSIKISGLKKNKHFKVSYKNNKRRGKATITIKGKGKIKGTRKITFRIK